MYVRQYCAEIDEAARNRMELIVRSLAEQNGVTEQLKAENQMEWVRQMNACKAQAEEVVKAVRQIILQLEEKAIQMKKAEHINKQSVFYMLLHTH